MLIEHFGSKRFTFYGPEIVTFILRKIATTNVVLSKEYENPSKCSKSAFRCTRI